MKRRGTWRKVLTPRGSVKVPDTMGGRGVTPRQRMLTEYLLCAREPAGPGGKPRNQTLPPYALEDAGLCQMPFPSPLLMCQIEQYLTPSQSLLPGQPPVWQR